VSNALARKAVKTAALPFGLVRSAGRNDLVILLYHRVGSGRREIDLTLPSFERQISYLARRGVVRTLDEAIDGRPGGVVVTFDDGFADFHRNVLPVLLRYRVPAHLYLATGLVEGEEQAEPGDALTWHQVAEALASGLVSVGSHTHSHADLARASRARAEEEMRRSKELIEDRLGVPCRHFAYPWSVASAGAEGAAEDLFDSAALVWGTNRHGALDRYRLARVPVLRSDGQAFFRAKTRGMLDGEATAYRLLRRGPWGRG
jgi:peptidoglycan/xylan/chitin deacetylase (PgdA/CDA1 family)